MPSSVPCRARTSEWPTFLSTEVKITSAWAASEAAKIADVLVPTVTDRIDRFTADGAIRTLLVNDDLKKKLSTGALVIARIDDRYELLPRVAADKVRERDAAMIVLDHGQANEPAAATSEDDAYYAQFKVPDDLVW